MEILTSISDPLYKVQWAAVMMYLWNNVVDLYVMSCSEILLKMMMIYDCEFLGHSEKAQLPATTLKRKEMQDLTFCWRWFPHTCYIYVVVGKPEEHFILF